MQTIQTGFDNEAMLETITLVFTTPGEIPATETITAPYWKDDQAAEAAGFAERTGCSLYTWKTSGGKNWLVIGRADLTDFCCFVALPEYRGDYVDLEDDDEIAEDGDTGDDGLERPATLTIPATYRLYLPTNDDIPESGYFDHTAVVNLLRKYKGNPEAIQFIADMME